VSGEVLFQLPSVSDAWSDESGVIRFDQVPDGQLAIVCRGGGAYSNGISRVPLGPENTLQVGDVITAVDGVDVRSLGENPVELLIRARAPGTPAHLGFLRQGIALSADLVVGKWQ
jgi:S1-C subfamily serine protease